MPVKEIIKNIKKKEDLERIIEYIDKGFEFAYPVIYTTAIKKDKENDLYIIEEIGVGTRKVSKKELLSLLWKERKIIKKGDLII